MYVVYKQKKKKKKNFRTSQRFRVKEIYEAKI